jgi:ribosomal RNA assembly protein
MMKELKVAGSRIGALIGKGGETKLELEQRTKTKIGIDSREGIVTVDGEDTALALRAMEVVEAINRGFSPERAFTLLDDEDLLFEVIDLSSVVDSPGQLARIRGRVIGKDGRAREQIENMTETMVSVLGKTIAVIGLPERIKVAHAAIDMLVSGVPHENVFAFLDKKKKEAKQDLISYYY